MKTIHKQFGEVQIKGQNEKYIIISTDSGEKKIMRMFAKNMLTNEDGSSVDFDQFNYIKEQQQFTFSNSVPGRKVTKTATILGKLEQIDFENE